MFLYPTVHVSRRGNKACLDHPQAGIYYIIDIDRLYRDLVISQNTPAVLTPLPLPVNQVMEEKINGSNVELATVTANGYKVG